ncbi:MAG: tetratricopeptide repeat protein [Candidatus Thorarchaeota archaeon]
MKDTMRTCTEVIAHSEQLLNEGKFSEALKLVDIIEARDDLTSLDQLSCLLLRSKLLSRLGFYKDSLEVAESAKEKCQRFDAPVHLVDALLTICEIYWFLGKFDESLETVEQIEQAMNEIPDEHQSELVMKRATLLNRRGNIYLRKGNFEDALHCYEQSLSIFEEIGGKQGEGESLYSIGTIQWRNGDLDLALWYFKKSLAVREEIGDKYGVASSLNAVGIIYRRKGDLNVALEYYKQSLALNEEMGNSHVISIALNNIGVVYRRKGDLDRALEYFERSLELKEEIGNKENIALTLRNVGLIYKDIGDLDHALEYLQRSLQLREEVANNLFTTETLFSLIRANIDHNLMEQARWHLERLVEINNEEDNIIIRQKCRVAEALVLKASSRPRDREKAKKLLSWVIEGEMLHEEVSMIAMVNFYDMVLVDLKVSGNQQAFDETRTLVCRLSEIAKEQLSYAFLAETHILKSKLALLEFNLLEARKLLTKAQIITDERGLLRLSMTISREHDTLLEEVNKWEELIENGASLVERAVLVDLQATVVDIIRKRVATQSERPTDEPVYISILHQGDGVTKFSKNFQPTEAEDLSSVIESASISLSSQSLNRARINDYTMLIQSHKPFLFCYVFKGQSFSAQQKLTKFVHSLSINDSMGGALNRVSNGESPLTESDTAIIENLIKEAFF